MPRRSMGGLFAFLAMLGCQAEPPTPPLRIAAASDLQHALPKILKSFEHNHNIKVVSTFGSSGQLAEQLKAGAPFDLFLAANQRFVANLVALDVIKSESVAPYAQGELVLIVGKRASDQVNRLDDLTSAAVRAIALANPDVAPYGHAGRQALQNGRLWSSIESKVVQAENVRQVLQFVTSGNAEVGFVGSALVNNGVEGLKVIPIEPSLYEPIVQYLGIVRRTLQPTHAEALRGFLLSDEGIALLKAHGFKPVMGLGVK